jgi:hypothetical protein
MKLKMKLGINKEGRPITTMTNIANLRERMNLCSQKIRRRVGRAYYLFDLLVNNSPLWCIAASGLLIGILFTTTSPILGNPNLTSDSILATGIIFMSFFGIPMLVKMYKMSKKFA